MTRPSRSKRAAGKTRIDLRSLVAYEAACAVLVGGVNSPVRAFRAVGGTPLFVAEAEGPLITDLDGNAYIDYLCSWGPLILGHADERCKVAGSKALSKGWSYGAPCETETRLAARIVADYPTIDMVRFVSSGTEAVMSALRLARGFTGRDLVVKCAGGYHGHADYLLVEAGSGLATFGTPSSAGVPQAIAATTLVVPYNDLEVAGRLFAEQGSKIAGFIVEPIAGNMGCILPVEGYLAGLRRLCDEYGVLLVFDEVITGYRVGLAGAQGLYGVRPDITCLGKVIGGGMPVGAYGAREEIMRQLSPLGSVYQAGTLSGNPLAMAVGLATVEALHEAGVYQQLEQKSARLADGLVAAARRAGVPICLNRVGSMLCIFFQEGPVVDYASARRSDTDRYARFFHAMLARGVYLPPSQYEVLFVSLAHTDEHIDRTIAAAEESFAIAAS